MGKHRRLGWQRSMWVASSDLPRSAGHPFLEANVALRSIVRRDTGDGYETFLCQLAAASGIATPTRAELARMTAGARRRGPTTTGRILTTRTRRSRR